MSSQPWVLEKVYNTTYAFAPVQQALSPIKKGVGYLFNIHAVIVFMAYLATLVVIVVRSSQDSKLCETVGGVSSTPPDAYRAPFSAMKAS